MMITLLHVNSRSTMNPTLMLDGSWPTAVPTCDMICSAGMLMPNAVAPTAMTSRPVPCRARTTLPVQPAPLNVPLPVMIAPASKLPDMVRFRFETPEIWMLLARSFDDRPRRIAPF